MDSWKDRQYRQGSEAGNELFVVSRLGIRCEILLKAHKTTDWGYSDFGSFKRFTDDDKGELDSFWLYNEVEGFCV